MKNSNILMMAMLMVMGNYTFGMMGKTTISSSSKPSGQLINVINLPKNSFIAKIIKTTAMGIETHTGWNNSQQTDYITSTYTPAQEEIEQIIPEDKDVYSFFNDESYAIGTHGVTDTFGFKHLGSDFIGKKQWDATTGVVS